MTMDSVFSLKIHRQNANFDPGDNIVLLTFDDNYMDQSVNLILSIAKYHPSGVSFVCVGPPLRQENVELLMSLQQGIRIQSYESAVDMASGRWVSSAVLRLFSPWLLEADIHSVLYLDSDILCTGSLQSLFETEVPYVAMCGEISGNTSATQQKTIRPYLPTQIYCNSGVTVFNLDSLREHYRFEQIYETLSNLKGKVVYLDQDFLNIYFQGKITVLNAFHYNFQAYELRGTPFYKNALRNCRLIHFSVGKPWLYKSKLYLIRLYLKHSQYPPMIERVKKTYIKSLLYSPIRLARHMLSPFKQALLALKK